jgi:hypothetical protein
LYVQAFNTGPFGTQMAGKEDLNPMHWGVFGGDIHGSGSNGVKSRSSHKQKNRHKEGSVFCLAMN